MGLTSNGMSALGSRLWALSVVNLIANIAIIVTGGAVRLTGSGLGCPNWPTCTEDSYVPHSELGIHGAIEFGNRMLTFVLVAVVVTCWLAARASRASTGDPIPLRLATLIALGVPTQAVIGGISVRMDLNPWVVALHMMVSLVMVSLCVFLLAAVKPARFFHPRGSSLRGWILSAYVVTWVTLYLGTVVTGSGPHAGDEEAPRNGLDSELVAHVHAFAVYVLVLMTVIVIVLAIRRGDDYVRSTAGVLLLVELAQGIVGVVQLSNGLPEFLVGIHLLGAALTVAAATRMLISAIPRGATVEVETQPTTVPGPP